MPQRRALLAAAVLGAVLLIQDPASAAFPGANGKIVFEDDNVLKTVGPDNQGVAAIPNTTGAKQPAVSATGTRIAVDGVRTFDFSGADQRVLSAGTDPAWSPDGQRIVFHNAGDLWLMNADGSGTPQQLTSGVATDNRPSWSPGGDRIAFVSNRSGEFQVWIVEPDGAPAWQATSIGDVGDPPSWSPDGSKVVYSIDDGTIVDLYVTAPPPPPLDPSNPPPLDPAGDQRITVNGASSIFNDEPAWSPDGTRIAFSSNRTGAREIWTVAPAGGGEAQVTTTGGRQPDWQPHHAVDITAGPSGDVTETTAHFEFALRTQPPPPGQLECSVDGGTFTACSSPQDLTGLASGEHVFQVRYNLTGGGPGPLAERRWSVGGECPEVRVGLAVAKGCFTERMVDGQPTGVFETEQDAWVGGFHLRPRQGGKLVVQDRPQAPLAAEGAGVDWVLGGQTVPAPLGEIQPFVPDFVLAVNTAGTFERFIQLPLLQGLSGQLKVTWDAGGRGAKVEASVSMEQLTKNLGKPLAGQLGLSGTSVGTLAGKLVFRFVNGQPAEVTEGELELPEFAVEVKGTNPKLKEGFGGGRFKAKRVGSTVEWSGEVSVLFPWMAASGSNQGRVTGRLYFQSFEMAGLGLGVFGFERPIGKTGWDLTGAEGDVIYRPSFALNVGVTAQQHSSFAGDHLLNLTGNVKALRLAETDCRAGSNPLEFVGTFNAPPLEAQKIGKLKGQLLMCAYLQGARNFAFEAGVRGDLTIDGGPFTKLISASGSAKGWFSGFDFNLDGAYQLKLPIIGTIGANGVLSSEGYAICGRYGFISAGIATNNWLEAPQDMTGCDFTPFRVAAPARAAGAGARTVRVPAGQTAVGMAVRGEGGAPRVRVTGPRGERFTSPVAGRRLKGAAALIHGVDEAETTYVFLREPRAGTWRIEPVDGTVPIQRIETSRQLPKPRVHARVRRAKHGRLVVSWQARRVPGQRIELVDRADGVATTIRRSTSRRRGRVTFRPANPLETRRTIEAVLLQDGSPRPPLVAARYRLRAPRRPSRPGKPSAKRTAAGLAIRWGKARRATEYLVTVTTGQTVLTRTITKRLRLDYSQPPAGRLAIRITPRDRFGRQGRAAKLSVR